jgi:hypothetical protein
MAVCTAKSREECPSWRLLRGSDPTARAFLSRTAASRARVLPERTERDSSNKEPLSLLSPKKMGEIG